MIGKWEYGRDVVVGCDKGTNFEVDLRDEAKSRAFQVLPYKDVPTSGTLSRLKAPMLFDVNEPEHPESGYGRRKESIGILSTDSTNGKSELDHTKRGSRNCVLTNSESKRCLGKARYLW